MGIDNIQSGAADDVSPPLINPAVAKQRLAAMRSDAPNELTVTDALGRSLTVRKTTPLDQFRLMKLYGERASAHVVNTAVIVCAVTAIDGEKIIPPGTDRQIEMLLQRLDNEGFLAAASAVRKLAPDTLDEDTVKNS